MPVFRLRLFASLSAALLLGCQESKPAAPVVEIPASGDTVTTRDSDVTGAAWLEGDRWAILAAPNETAGIVDFSDRKISPLGSGRTKALSNPSTLFVSQDSLYIGDWGKARTTVWTPAGRLIRSIPTSNAARGALPRARDSKGNFYLDQAPLAGPDGSGNRDSGAVLLLKPGLTRADTIARLAPLDIAEVVGDAGRRFERRVFGGLDRWGALPDGSVWVARVYDNRVDWRAPDGKWTRGQALPDRVLEVTRYDRELFLQKFPPELRGTAQQLPFAPIKPPFEAALTSADGQVWLEKSGAPADSFRVYHVVDGRGRLAQEVRLRSKGRVLAVGPRSVLVAESTPDGTRLQRVDLTLPARNP
ncbi:MAG TPA: hypothetical protein VNO19_10640 [Gemmatimonadales bacterium]|nr:hypothetical protein [Gemmatimonadales bacterium]